MKSIVLAFLIAFAVQGNAKICKKFLAGPTGVLQFRMDENDRLPCKFVYTKFLGAKNYFNIVAVNKNSEKATFKISGGKRKRSMKLIRTLEVPRNSTREITLSKNKHLKIVPVNASHFSLRYEVIACPVPKSLEKISCSNGYRRKSRCSFQCSSGYLPKSLKQPKFTAMCRKTKKGKNTWGKNLSLNCLQRNTMISVCLAKFQRIDSPCPYSPSDLAKILNEESTAGEPDLNKIDQASRVSLPRIRQPIRGTVLQPNFAVASIVKPVVATEEQVKCKYHCARKSGGNFYYMCGQLKNETRLLSCLQCRYSGTKCEGKNPLL